MLDRDGEHYDPKKAVEYLTGSAKQGYTVAKYMLGKLRGKIEEKKTGSWTQTKAKEAAHQKYMRNLFRSIEQLRMTAYTVKHQHKDIVQHLIDKQPIRFNIALPTAFIVAGQVVIPKLCLKRLSVCQLLDYRKQPVGILSLFLCKLQIFLELRCKFYLVLHSASAAFRPDISV